MAERPFTTTKRKDLLPVCPHCSQALAEVYYRGAGAGFIQGRDVVFFCPHCSKVLGFGQSRMI